MIDRHTERKKKEKGKADIENTNAENQRGFGGNSSEEQVEKFSFGGAVGNEKRREIPLEKGRNQQNLFSFISKSLSVQRPLLQPCNVPISPCRRGRGWRGASRADPPSPCVPCARVPAIHLRVTKCFYLV